MALNASNATSVQQQRQALLSTLTAAFDSGQEETARDAHKALLSLDAKEKSYIEEHARWRGLEASAVPRIHEICATDSMIRIRNDMSTFTTCGADVIRRIEDEIAHVVGFWVNPLYSYCTCTLY